MDKQPPVVKKLDKDLENCELRVPFIRSSTYGTMPRKSESKIDKSLSESALLSFKDTEHYETKFQKNYIRRRAQQKPISLNKKVFSIPNILPEGDHKIPEIKRSPSYFKGFTSEQLFRELECDPKHGLTVSKVVERQKMYGSNELERQKPTPWWRVLLEQFNDMLIILLIISAIISAAFQHYAEFGAILFIVIMNALIGFIQQGKAADAIGALEKITVSKVLVHRSGATQEIDITTIVPGDIVIIEPGAKIPADCILFEGNEISVDESILTGESEPVTKSSENKENMLFRGCLVMTGRGRAIVISIGMNTRMGEISKLLNSVEETESPLQERLDRLGKWLGYASLGLSLVIFIIGVTTGRGADENSDQPTWLQMLLIAVSLTVAAVPEGLPVCVQITLSIGMRVMALKNSIVRNLKSVETLGSASDICSDKTGTLTSGKMTAVAIQASNGDYYDITGVGYEIKGEFVYRETKNKPDNKMNNENLLDKIISVAGLCNGANLAINEGKVEVSGNMTDRALLIANKKYKRDINSNFIQKMHELPFDSSRKMMTVVYKHNKSIFDEENVVMVKGALQYLLPKCTQLVTNEGIMKITSTDNQNINHQCDFLCSQAYRVLGLAYKNVKTFSEDNLDLEEDLIFIGMIAIFDPPREGVREAIEKCKTAKVRVVMITGDYLETAVAVAKNIGILDDNKRLTTIDCRTNDCQAIDCSMLDNLDGVQLEEIVLKTRVFARAKPTHKISIVDVLQKNNRICAMTGDGVNDAPALKKADIGVAMGITGTEVAKAAAQMILTDDSFTSIVLAIEEGRRIYSNIGKFVYYLLSTNPAEVMLILIAALIGLQSPLVPVQILWLNLTTDSAAALALAMEPLEQYIMKKPPRVKGATFIDKPMFIGIILHNVVLTIVTLATYIYGLYIFTGVWDGKPTDMSDDDINISVSKAQTMTIYVIVFSELLRAYTCRSFFESCIVMGIRSNMWMIPAVFGAIGLTFLIGNVPHLKDVFSMEYLDGHEWGFIFGISFVPPVFEEIVKFVFRRVVDRYH